MKFTKDSEQIMSLMMDEFEMFVKKKTVSQQRSFDRIMKIFYMPNDDDNVKLLSTKVIKGSWYRLVINQINNNQQSNNQKTEVMAGNMDITIDPYTDRQLTSFGSVYP